MILEVDYAAKMSQFTQDAMPCSAAKQTSNFVVYAHFNPQHDEHGNNIGDTTEVFSFHSNCVIQDTHSIRRCLKHVIENLKQRGFLTDTVHLWQDGSAAQNKGRKAFRQVSDAIKLLCKPYSYLNIFYYCSVCLDVRAEHGDGSENNQ